MGLFLQVYEFINKKYMLGKMKYKANLSSMFLSVLFSSSFASSTLQHSIENKNKRRPNVIVIMTDDQGYGELSVHGNPILKTPQLDKLHEESIRLTDFHVAPMSTPTRGQLLTGLDAVRNGAVNVSSGRSLLRKDLKTIANYYSESGYDTGIFGKWHLGDNYPFRPEDRGFDETLWFPSSHIGSVPDYWGNDYFDDIYMRNGKRETFQGYCTDVFFNEAIKWMKKCKEDEKPFFAYLPTNAPHQPFYAPESDILEMQRAVENSKWSGMETQKKHDFIRFLAMIRNIDSNVGNLMGFLNQENLDKNTILVFMTDNGSTFGPNYFNANMRGGKTELYEGGHRVPFFIRWSEAKGFDQPRDIDGLTQVQDVLPTLLDLCEIEFDSKSFSGQSLAPAFSGGKLVQEDRVLFVNFSQMPFYFDYPSPYSNSIMKESGGVVLWKNWRLLRDAELYDLNTDPLQKNNLFSKHQEIVEYLTKKRSEWWTKVDSTVNKPERIIIGSDEENPLLLTACDWLDVFVDQQKQVKRGVQKNSYWLLDIAKDGIYEFQLRRWPEEYDMPLNSSGSEEKAFSIAFAKIFINGDENDLRRRFVVDSDDKMVLFTAKLNCGKIALHTWFEDSNGEAISGAYYVYVHRK